MLPAQSDPEGRDQEMKVLGRRERGEGEGEGEGEEAEADAEAEASWPLPLASASASILVKVGNSSIYLPRQLYVYIGGTLQQNPPPTQCS